MIIPLNRTELFDSYAWKIKIKKKEREKKKMEIETTLLSVNCAASNEIFYQSSIVEQCSSLKKEESNGVYFV